MPLALLGLLFSDLGCVVSQSPREMPLVVILSLIGGYVSMGAQSLLFALGMRWLERREVSRRGRYIAAAFLGGMFGATLLVPLGQAATPYIVLGAGVGPAAIGLADLVAPTDGEQTRRGSVWRGLAILAWVGCSGLVGGTGYRAWIDASRRSVLAAVVQGMTYEDVMRVAGSPTDDTRKLFRPSEAVDVVWQYDRSDPGGADVLVVSVSFKSERVVDVARRPVSRG
ncbi:MAG: hypothetical protein KDC48_07305 [Planctomycetes bacterium]|nr:hypothetical protein [Planctomycetota bacterium]